MTILALIIGTIIYHLEKNTYCYILQSVFLNAFYFFSDRKRENESVTETKGGNRGRSKELQDYVINCVQAVYSFLSGNVRYLRMLLVLMFVVALNSLFWVGLNGATGAFVAISAVLVMFLAKPIYFYQKVWSITKPLQNEREEVIKPHLIMKHLDAWSDNIHCVQCCCFAWVFGAFFAKVQSIQDKYLSCDCYICPNAWSNFQTTISEVLNSVDCKIAFGVLFLELLFEFHRFFHLYNIVENK